jgi:hypothetical protein
LVLLDNASYDVEHPFSVLDVVTIQQALAMTIKKTFEASTFNQSRRKK